MKVFFDTEFTDLINDCEIISLGMVSEYGEEFYIELPFDTSKSSQFVKEIVIPLLGKEPNTDSYLNAPQCIFNWFNIIRNNNEIIELCSDSEMDWKLLKKLFNNKIPNYIQYKNIMYNIAILLEEEFYRIYKLPQHHALYDAKCHAFCFREN